MAQAAAGWHYIAGSVFTLGLALRTWVLFSDKCTDRASDHDLYTTDPEEA